MAILAKIFESPELTALFWFLSGVAALAAFLGAIRKIHEFGTAARTKPGQAERERLSKQFEALRFEILSVSTVNNYPVVLHKLRRFIIENGLANNPAVEDFFHSWLSHPIVESGQAVLAPGMYSSGNLSRLERELRELRLYPIRK